MPNLLPNLAHPPFIGLPARPAGFAIPQADNAPVLPLQGVTVLAVEDSRFASDALRLMCLRAGARLRRADTLAAARAHLAVYRPDVVIVDLGLPDGSGESLIRRLVMSPRRPSAVLGCSGLDTGRRAALAAGADGFLAKPVESLAAFCDLMRQHLPSAASLSTEDCAIAPDLLALQDDLSHAAAALSAAPDRAEGIYLARFVKGLAQCAHDPALEQAAAAAEASPADLDALRALLDARLGPLPSTFGESD